MSVMWPRRSAFQRGATRMPVAIASGEPAVDGVEERGVGTVELHQRERERMVERMLRGRLRDPRPRRHRSRGTDVDEVVLERGTRIGVPFERRNDHARAAADPDEALSPSARS